MRQTIRSHAPLGLLATLAAVTWACGGSSSSPGAPSPTPTATTSTFQGTVAGSGLQTGTLSVTVQAQVSAARPARFHLPFVATLHAQSATASGTLRFAGGSASTLSGTYDTATKRLSLSGGGYTASGTVSEGVLAGTLSGNGVSGGFSTRSTSGATVTSYCGTITQRSGNQAAGVFNLEVASTGAVSGVFCVRQENAGGGDPCGFIKGQATGSSISITHGDSSSTGTISGTTVSGTSVTGNTFSGSTGACQ